MHHGNDKSTGNLCQHIQKCDRNQSEGSVKMMEEYAELCTLEVLYWKLLHWVVRKNWLYIIVEDEELLDIFKTLKPEVEIPCANTISTDIKELSSVDDASG